MRTFKREGGSHRECEPGARSGGRIRLTEALFPQLQPESYVSLFPAYRMEGKAATAVQGRVRGLLMLRGDEVVELIRPPTGEGYDGY